MPSLERTITRFFSRKIEDLHARRSLRRGFERVESGDRDSREIRGPIREQFPSILYERAKPDPSTAIVILRRLCHRINTLSIDFLSNGEKT